jgi:serine/threonine-protein kinase
VGRIIADRYEILSLIGAGGMGRVYRAVQRSLGRKVAIKVIHPHLTDAPLLVKRFMIEALTASRLNHPHIVSVFDFGQMAEAEGGNLFLVMELCNGVSLGDFMRVERELSFERAVTLLRQTLEALAEAHDRGITHRDMKPDNIILTQRRSGGDHVKVIDFGMAQLGPFSGRISEHGQICGTPAYMAPEQGAGETLDPRADIYSVGVVMFEMLTGMLPFVASTPAALMIRHMTAPRPDPRKIAPHRNIPDVLAEICLQAMEIDPARRFQSAEAFEDALACAVPSPSFTSRTFPPPARESNLRSVYPALEETVPMLPLTAPSDLPARPALTAPFAGGAHDLIGRDQELAWARDRLRAPDAPPAIALFGAPGTGRTRLLAEICADAERDGVFVVTVPLAPAPRSEVGYQGLRKMILGLSGLAAEALAHGQVAGVGDRWAIRGFRAVFKRSAGRLPADPVALRRGAAAALAWAARCATERAEGRRALLAIDDIERLDGASRLALDDLLHGPPIRGFSVLVTGERPPGGAFSSAPSRALRGLSFAEATAMLARRGGSLRLPRSDDDIEPLYLAELGRLSAADQPSAPASLPDLLAFRVQALPPAQRRLLQAVAVAGGGPLDELSLLLRRPNEADEALQPLVEGGFLRQCDGEVTVAHTLMARAAIAAAPGGAIAALQEAAADALALRHDLLELRAYHALRGRPDFQAFMMQEEAAHLRTARGDDRGAIAALWDAVNVARGLFVRGELEAASVALSVFGRKLATALANDGELDKAEAVLGEVLDMAAPADTSRALLLEQIAALAQLRGKPEEALERRREALRIAEQCGDADLAERLRAFVTAPSSERTPEPPRGEPEPWRATRAGIRAPAPPVLIVDDDRSIREGLKSVVESAGHQAFVAGNGREAIEMLQKIPRPALLLLDLMMPVMTGWELLSFLRRDEAFATVPVIVLSAVPSRDELGTARVVQKPVDVGVLLDIVEEFCG